MNTDVVILDFGSQYTQLIARAVRQLGVYCEIEPFSISISDLKAKNPKALIFSGGPSSVSEARAPKILKAVLDFELPTLGICYGMQLLSKMLQGKVESGGSREYGPSQLTILENSGIFKGLALNSEIPVWMSHGDSVDSVPEGAIITAKSSRAKVAAFQYKHFHAIQFHPEVAHTPKGLEILGNFIFHVSKLKPNWKMDDFLDAKKKTITELVGDSQVIGGVSGGVDSTVLSVFLHKILGKKFHPVLVDNGLLRSDEAKEVKKFLKSVGVALKVVDASAIFLKRLKGVSDPEQKRKIIGKTFIDIFEKETKRIKNVKFLAQGTLYPDVIESVSVRGPSHTIKTHHNVGGLPKNMRLKLIEPFRELFKDEVRELGAQLGIPPEILGRHPFPGPGLAVRVLGAVSAEKIKLLQRADSIFTAELKEADLYRNTWQAFVVLLPVQSVGVMGDARTYESVVALRAITSRDGMTADWFGFSKEFLAKVSNRIINEVPGINRVVYDVSSKPPATIEWE